MAEPLNLFAPDECPCHGGRGPLAVRTYWLNDYVQPYRPGDAIPLGFGTPGQ